MLSITFNQKQIRARYPPVYCMLDICFDSEYQFSIQQFTIYEDEFYHSHSIVLRGGAVDIQNDLLP
jgi:hypothetical protein